jgi:hypothetical protein
MMQYCASLAMLALMQSTRLTTNISMVATPGILRETIGARQPPVIR